MTKYNIDVRSDKNKHILETFIEIYKNEEYLLNSGLLEECKRKKLYFLYDSMSDEIIITDDWTHML